MIAAALIVAVLVTIAYAQPIFPPWSSIERGRPTFSNDTTTLPACPYGTSTLPFITQQVGATDTWDTLAAAFGLSNARILLLNNMASEDSMDLVPGTFVYVYGPPSAAPSCACPLTSSVITDDELYCTTAAGTTLTSRVGTGAYYPGLATDGSGSFWRSATNRAAVYLTVPFTAISELQTIDIVFSPLSSFSAFPTATGIEIATDSSLATWLPIAYYAQNCASFAGLPSGVPCNTVGNVRALYSVALPVNATSSMPYQAYGLRLRLVPSSTTKAVEVRYATAIAGVFLIIIAIVGPNSCCWGARKLQRPCELKLAGDPDWATRMPVPAW